MTFRATSNTVNQIIPKVFNGIQIRAFYKCNVTLPEEIHSIPGCRTCGIIMSDIGIILKQWDNVSRKYFISVALDIQIPFDIHVQQD